MAYTVHAAPHRPAIPSRWARVSAWLAERHQRRIDRAAFRTLLGLDDQMLKDIGVTRDEVRRAASLPLSQNAALELQRAAWMRRGKI